MKILLVKSISLLYNEDNQEPAEEEFLIPRGLSNMFEPENKGF
jgi:hypothetical protein